MKKTDGILGYRYAKSEMNCSHSSVRTLSGLLEEAGLTDSRFLRVGQVPALAKSMIAIARKPR